jgi:hypothetical protein
MFADLLRLISRRTAEVYEYAFVKEVHAVRGIPADPKVEKLILACWGLIALKHIAVIWAVHRYAVPFHQLWINFPTFLLGVIATAAYYWRE